MMIGSPLASRMVKNGQDSNFINIKRDNSVLIETGELNLPVNEGKVNNHIVSSSNIQPASALVELGSLVLNVTNPINQQSSAY